MLCDERGRDKLVCGYLSPVHPNIARPGSSGCSSNVDDIAVSRRNVVRLWPFSLGVKPTAVLTDCVCAFVVGKSRSPNERGKHSAGRGPVIVLHHAKLA